jgi:tape measure domain-containing protein
MAVDEVVLRAVIKDELSAGLRTIERNLERVDRKTDQIGRHRRGVDGLSRSFTGLGDQVRAVDGRLRTASASLGSLAAQATRTASIGLGTLGVAATGFGLNASASFERSRIAFGTLVESMEGGTRLFEQLQQFNLQTPFELGEISAATQTLLQFGFTGDNVMETLRSISDIASTTSAPGENLNRIALALGQISSAGVLRGQDLNQLVQAGFPAYQLLTQVTGQTTQELRKQMETGLTLPAEEFIAALNEGGGVLAKFASGAQAQAGTLSGVFSNLKDTTQVQLAEAFQPLADGLKEALPGFSQTLGAFIDDVAPPLSRIGLILVESVGTLLPIIEPPLTALLTGLGTLLEAMTPAFGALEPVMGDLGLAIGEMVTALVPVMPDLVDALVAVVGVLPEMVRLLTSFTPLISPLANLVENLAELDGVAAGLLVTLIGYRVLSTVAGSVMAMANALTALNAAQTLTGGPRGGVPPVAPLPPGPRGSRFAGLGRLAAGVAAGAGAFATSAAIPLVATIAGVGEDIKNFGGSGTTHIEFQNGKAVRVPGAARFTAAPQPTSAGGSVTVGQITVNNPTSNIDVSRAVAAGIAEERRMQNRRG